MGSAGWMGQEGNGDNWIECLVKLFSQSDRLVGWVSWSGGLSD